MRRGRLNECFPVEMVWWVNHAKTQSQSQINGSLRPYGGDRNGDLVSGVFIGQST